MIRISAETVHNTLNYPELIRELKSGFSQQFKMPQRHIHQLSDNPMNKEVIALLPSWNKEFICTKIFNYFPKNKQPLKSLYSNILLFNRTTGESLALVDGTSITYWRTAAVSALSSQFLSRENSKSLLLFGTGHLARYLINAHLTVRNIKNIIIAGRSIDKISKLINQCSIEHPNINFQASLCLESEIPSSDIICCATASPTPLFDGNLVSPGTHIDCLGNHSPDQRECDSYTVINSKVYVDSLVNTLNEAGELLIPMNNKCFDSKNIIGELKDLCRDSEIHRNNEEDITLFKSVGTALSDLIATQLVYKIQSN